MYALGDSLHCKTNVRLSKRIYQMHIDTTLKNRIFETKSKKYFDNRFGKVLIFQGFCRFLISKTNKYIPQNSSKSLFHKVLSKSVKIFNFNHFNLKYFINPKHIRISKYPYKISKNHTSQT